MFVRCMIPMKGWMEKKSGCIVAGFLYKKSTLSIKNGFVSVTSYRNLGKT